MRQPGTELLRSRGTRAEVPRSRCPASRNDAYMTSPPPTRDGLTGDRFRARAGTARARHSPLPPVESGVPAGLVAAMAARACSAVLPVFATMLATAFFTMSVSVYPGQTALTVTAVAAASRASARVRPTRQCSARARGVTYGRPAEAGENFAMLTMRRVWSFTIRGRYPRAAQERADEIDGETCALPECEVGTSEGAELRPRPALPSPGMLIRGSGSAHARERRAHGSGIGSIGSDGETRALAGDGERLERREVASQQRELRAPPGERSGDRCSNSAPCAGPRRASDPPDERSCQSSRRPIRLVGRVVVGRGVRSDRVPDQAQCPPRPPSPARSAHAQADS